MQSGRVVSKTEILPEISFARLGAVPGLSAERTAAGLPCEIDGGVGFTAVRAPDPKPRLALSALVRISHQ
jgi:hypothetical protein